MLTLSVSNCRGSSGSPMTMRPIDERRTGGRYISVLPGVDPDTQGTRNFAKRLLCRRGAPRRGFGCDGLPAHRVHLYWRPSPFPYSVRARSRLTMPSYTTADIRNVLLVGHGGCGKTTLADALLFESKAVTRKGSVTDGTSFS